MDHIDAHILRTQLILDAKFKEGEIKQLYIPEILEGIAAISSFKDRVYALRKNSDRSLNTLLQYTFGGVKLILTKEEVNAIEYTPSFADDDYSIAPSTLFDQARRFYIFAEGSIVPKERLIKILTEALEYLHPDEAEILKGMFAGKLPYKNITKKLVQSAFPSLFDPLDDLDDDGETVKAVKVVEKMDKHPKPAPKAAPAKKKPVAKKETKPEVPKEEESK